jgi:hypothetical protein
MPWTSEHIDWLEEIGELSTTEGHPITVLQLNHEDDDHILSAWAKHFRNHYCRDNEIDVLRNGTGKTRAEYLVDLKFPDRKAGLGPGTRSGDFAEILVADYLEYVLGYWVPRTRYADKTIRNESTKGCDIIGIRLLADGDDSLEDTLATFEAKAQFSGATCKPKLQEAIDHSAKDQLRKAESLNAMKQRLFHDGDTDGMARIERFQNPEDRPYTEVSGAAALFCASVYDDASPQRADASQHPNVSNLLLVVIHGDAMMSLVHDLYERAANEA